jgi:hypothetical protein
VSVYHSFLLSHATFFINIQNRNLRAHFKFSKIHHKAALYNSQRGQIGGFILFYQLRLYLRVFKSLNIIGLICYVQITKALHCLVGLSISLFLRVVKQLLMLGSSFYSFNLTISQIVLKISPRINEIAC